MKNRFLIFSGSSYEWCGGWGDFITACDNIEEVDYNILYNPQMQHEWEVVDLMTLKKVRYQLSYICFCAPGYETERIKSWEKQKRG